MDHNLDYRRNMVRQQSGFKQTIVWNIDRKKSGVQTDNSVDYRKTLMCTIDGQYSGLKQTIMWTIDRQ